MELSTLRAYGRRLIFALSQLLLLLFLASGCNCSWIDGCSCWVCRRLLYLAAFSSWGGGGNERHSWNNKMMATNWISINRHHQVVALDCRLLVVSLFLTTTAKQDSDNESTKTSTTNGTTTRLKRYHLDNNMDLHKHVDRTKVNKQDKPKFLKFNSSDGYCCCDVEILH
jgi:hypothetical protein